VSQNSDYFRQKVWFIINTIQANQLYVHSSVLEVKYIQEDLEEAKITKGKSSGKSKMITKSLPEILTMCVLNAIVPNSAMLLIGGHGGGKTSIVKHLARMFTGISLNQAEDCIIRGHPQLTEEKIIGTLNIKKLMKDGEEEVIWRTFSTSFWKIIDEVNRCTSYVQNILLSLLAEGKIKYYDSVQHVSKYVVFATLNPNDVGTFELSAPFMDRFGISIPIAMPKSQDLAVILGSHDEKLGGYDELVQVPAVLTIENLMSIWYQVENIPCSKEAEDFIHALIREYTLCDRVDKGNSEYLKPSTGLCSGCHFNIPEHIPCSNVDTILSVRVAKDLLRYAKALSWLLGIEKVSIDMVTTVAPYVISHRAMYLDRGLNQSPYWGSKILFTKNMLSMILKRFNARAPAYEAIRNFEEGIPTTTDMNKLEQIAKNDLITRLDLLPYARELSQKEYQAKIQEILEAEQKRDTKKIIKIQQELLHDMEFPCRGRIITRLNNIMRTLTLKTYSCAFSTWELIRHTISAKIPDFTYKLKETVQHRGTYHLRAGDVTMEINVTGINPEDMVTFEFYGGVNAELLKDALEKSHHTAFRSTDELIEEANKAAKKRSNQMGVEAEKIGFKSQLSDEDIELDDD
jgi:MoxR-like ATPase